MSTLRLVIGCAAACAVVGAAVAAVPAPSEQFTAHLQQYAVSTDKLLVDQTMVLDKTNNRGRSNFAGPSFPHPFDQVIRYDLGEVYVLQNVSGSSVPICQSTAVKGHMSTFFDFPANASYVGQQKVFGVTCDVWTYWDMGSKFQFAGTNSTTQKGQFIPVKVEQLGSWYTHYSNFVAGTPPMSDYALPVGVKCEPAPPSEIVASSKHSCNTPLL